MSGVIVPGAGMAGMALALALGANGKEALPIDRRGIGRKTGFGNAGMIRAPVICMAPVRAGLPPRRFSIATPF